MGRSSSRKKYRAISGIVLLDKPLGLSSNQVLQKVRHLFQAQKAGHTGSLDPQASGMLPICLGEASKVSAYLLDANKQYQTWAQLGQTSTTGDSEGELSTPKQVPALSDAELEHILQAFRGAISQIPPMYSALKKDGKALYELARQGIEVERPPRQVVIHELQLLAQTAQQLQLDVLCSKGTYIRTLVEDIGHAMGCGAYVAALRRTGVEPFNDYPMYTMTQLQQHFDEGGLDALDACLLPMDKALPHLPSLHLTDQQVTTIRFGQRQAMECADAALLRLYDPQQQFIGLGQVVSGKLMPKRLLVH